MSTTELSKLLLILTGRAFKSYTRIFHYIFIDHLITAWVVCCVTVCGVPSKKVFLHHRQICHLFISFTSHLLFWKSYLHQTNWNDSSDHINLKQIIKKYAGNILFKGSNTPDISMLYQRQIHSFCKLT